MDQFFPVIFISIVVAFVLIKNIKRITEKMDIDALNPYDKYAKFSAHIQEYIRDIKKDISKTDSGENLFVLADNKDLEVTQEKLSDFIRKLVFFETSMAKNRSKQDIESELAQTLIDLDSFVKENIKNGELIAQKMKDDLESRFQELTS
jgi:valyl-tRNA synthetase